MTAEGETKKPFKYLLVSGAINCALNFYFVTCLDMTVDGVAIANIIAQYISAFYIACTSFISQNYGAKNKERIKKNYLITTVYSFGLAVIFGAIIHVTRFKILYIFTNDAEVVDAVAIRLGILSITYCLSAFMDNATSACRGLGKTVIPTIIVMMGLIVLRIVWVYTVFAYFGTLESIYPLYGCSFVLTAIFGNLYFLYLYRKLE